MFCTASAGADNRNRLYFADLGDPMRPNVTAPIVPIVSEDRAQFQVIGNVGAIAYILTDYGSRVEGWLRSTLRRRIVRTCARL